MARLDGMESGHDDLRIRAGISYRQLDHWCRSGYIPGITRATDSTSRQGVPRVFNAVATRRVIMLGRLTRAGLPVARAATLAATLERQGSVPLGNDLVLMDRQAYNTLCAAASR